MSGVTETAHYYSFNTENSKILVRSQPNTQVIIIRASFSVITANEYIILPRKDTAP